jgi:hypothetical protein
MSGRSVAKLSPVIVILWYEGRMSADPKRIQQMVSDPVQRGRTSQFATEEPRL